MNWGNDIIDWLASDEGQQVVATAIVPAVAIVVAGIIAALIGRGSTKRVIAQYQRDALTAAVQGLVLAGRKAASWNAIGTVERVQVDHLIGEAETRIRLLPVPGAALAANWSAHQLEDMKRNSAGFSFQAQQTLAEYRDRLIAWNEKPRRAKKLFGADLERWKYEADPDEQRLVAEQVEWETARVNSDHERSVGTPAAAQDARPAPSAPAPAPQSPAAASPASAPAPAAAPALAPAAYAPPPAVAPPTVAPATVVAPVAAPPSTPASPSTDAEASSEDAPEPKSASSVRERTQPDPEI
ncbi:hypothetical protein EV141_0458 [Microcella putealis]|uniref:Uncharacterized protein n=1 Tax=Microcella putealis TaxID=337005 RepID=A0A4V2EXE8_9MICO|nr:hypothetical protein [Microcella putealis]RZS59240.1 hypothetical protein EV141_0458 [Microcella putealis]